MTTVLIADDQALVRMGFRLILDAEADLEVVAEAGDGDEAVRLCRQWRPDVVLMDVRMPGTDGIAATAQVIADRPGTRVLILTTFDLDDYVHAGLRAGASGFLLKDALGSELVAAVRTVAAGDAVLAPAATRRLVEHMVSQPARLPESDPGVLSELTPRETEVFALVAQGLSNREVAARLHLSEGTVKLHVSRVLTKLALRDRVHLVVLAYETGLVAPAGRHPASET